MGARTGFGLRSTRSLDPVRAGPCTPRATRVWVPEGRSGARLHPARTGASAGPKGRSGSNRLLSTVGTASPPATPSDLRPTVWAGPQVVSRPGTSLTANNNIIYETARTGFGVVSTRLRASRRRRVVRRTTTAFVPRVGLGPAGLRPSRITGGPPPNPVSLPYGQPCACTPNFAGFARLGSALGPGESPRERQPFGRGALLARCTRSLLTPSGRSGRACQVCRESPCGRPRVDRCRSRS